MAPDDAGALARQLWMRVEVIHAVAYFAPQVRDRLKGLGLKGGWMAYFAGRAAPLGAVRPEVVVATFYGFAPRLVHRALPDAWTYASPDRVVDAQRSGVAEALREALDDLSEDPAVARAADGLLQLSADAEPAGHPLYAAWAALEPPAAPLVRLWHAATLLREHRGDGHVAVLTAAGLGPVEAHLTLVGTGTVPFTTLEQVRGWTTEQWAAGMARLRSRGLMGRDDRLTDTGTALRLGVEERTDLAAARAWADVPDHIVAGTIRALDPLVDRLERAGVLPYPNPVGVPRRGR